MTQSTDIYGAADYLSISVPTIKRRLKANTFPKADAVENGVDWWTVETLDKYIRSIKRKQTAKTRKKRVK